MPGTLMVQGTSSNAGKSLTVTGLVRVLRQDGWAVAPFKAQNMSLNSYPAIEGGEIGRAQVAQAEAAGLPPSVDFNPVLLKPTTDVGAQVIVRGRSIGNMDARTYHDFKPSLLPLVEESLDRLRARYDAVIIEGAGSPAEINLRENDIVNMAVAHLADAPVLLVADIDRGGVFASLYGTWALLDDADRARLRGFIVNKFRGDVTILEPGLRELEERTGMRCLGVLPYLRDVGVDDEDSVALEESTGSQARRPAAADGWPEGEGPKVAVVRLPRVSNFTDFRPLEDCGLFRVRWAEEPANLQGADLVVLPGTKSTVGDLLSLRERGFETAMAERRQSGAHFLGVCGGYQMLGERILDPESVESAESEVRGLGLLPVVTTFAADKVTEPVQVRGAGGGWLDEDAGVEGYEIHMGRSESACRPLFLVDGRGALDVAGAPRAERPEGAVSDDGRVAGTYVHGLFDDYSVLAGLARQLGVDEDRIEAGRHGWADHAAAKEAAYDRLAAVFREHLDLDFVRALLRGEA
ncbi:MAG: cobyric acid synthase [Thermoleophilia bacterium]|nr:cobyric acid synthase [Thermoleophilia bacterium]